MVEEREVQEDDSDEERMNRLLRRTPTFLLMTLRAKRMLIMLRRKLCLLN